MHEKFDVEDGYSYREEPVIGREKIENEYVRKATKIRRNFYIGALTIGALEISGMCSLGLIEDPYKNSEEYKNIETTLQELKGERNRVRDFKLSYQPENLKSDFESLFGERERKAEILDRAISTLEADLSNIKNSTNFKAYEIIKNRIINGSMLLYVMSVVSLIGLLIYTYIKDDRILKERSAALKELDELQ